jgi:HAD superfamily hydrolase (TIGR01484 family)
MQALEKLSTEKKRSIKCLFADIDDTITTEGRLSAQAYSAMERWQNAGNLMIPITGRPAGWCDHIARMWPVDAVVGENGAFYFYYDSQKGRLQQRFLYDADIRQENRFKMHAIREQVLAQVPGTGIASDQNYREADLAIDFCEDVNPLDDNAVDQIVEIMESGGMTAKISSIHVNGWFGDYDKLSMTKLLLEERFNVDLDLDKDRYAFVGDSPNDSPMFGYFPVSVGVRNIVDFIDRIEHKPAYITRRRAGAGFAELVDNLLE